METIRKPPINYIERITATYSALGYEPYEWYFAKEDPKLAAISKPLSESRLGVIATGGIYKIGQVAFTYKDDVTYRAIPSDASSDDLRATHFAYDLTDAREDINVVFPIEALQEIQNEGLVKELAPSFFTCMGGIYSQRLVKEELAPALVQRCLDDEIDVVLLIPV
ncbi:MAG: glycine/sarcosine/betaine reductase selenoprotein B family protein [Actinomycetota bacterium]|nr:glycine/sarcosine/betaine reductase selenoprotein B family protein [Actinomycetota bacterium]